jgi:hypothetical protein
VNEPAPFAFRAARVQEGGMNEDQLTTVILASVMLVLLALVVAALRYNWLDVLAAG